MVRRSVGVRVIITVPVETNYVVSSKMYAIFSNVSRIYSIIIEDYKKNI